MSHQDVSALVTEMQSLLSTKKGAKPTMPSTQQLYRLGRILNRFHQSDASNPVHSNAQISNLMIACQSLLSSLSVPYLASFFATIKIAIKKLSQRIQQGDRNSQPSSFETLSEAISSIFGLVSRSPHICRAACSKDFLIELTRLYDTYSQEAIKYGDNEPSHQKKSRENILGIISFILLDGPLSLDVQRKKSATGAEGVDNFMQLIQSIEDESTEVLGDLQEWQITNDPKRRTLEGAIDSYFRPFAGNQSAISDQLEYLLSMLDTAKQAHAERSGPVAATANPENPKVEQKPIVAVSAADELERRILQVQNILPDLGQGFIETALSLFQGNVETTVATLLSDPSQYPPSLQMIDRTLPRRRKERSAEEAEASREARQLVKERVAVEQKQEEERYKSFLYVAKQAQDEYNDDYDDQFDDMDGGGLGGADSGWSDMEHVKAYNQVAREEERENAFWEENRNLNKGAKGGQQPNSESGEKQFRGPDKIQGGRVIGPDGKVVKRPGRGRNNNNGGNNKTQQQQSQPKDSEGKKNSSTKNDGKGHNGQQKPTGQGGGGGAQSGAKPRTKPKSGNRINQKRDRKQKAQGTFGT